jgi:hypothetical protein
MPRNATSQRLTLAGTAVITLLLLMRVPSLAEPMAADQGLYSYIGTRVLAGDVPYRDAWDQKPPGIHFVYALMWRVWPHESVVAGADLAAAALVAWLLVLLGRRTFGRATGYGAACLFLLFGNPAFQRLGGVYVRSQCETFIALAVAAALVWLAAPARTRWHLLGAGAALGVAFWLKYNAAAYALPIALLTWRGDDGRPRSARSVAIDLAWLGVGFLCVAAAIVGYFAAHHALLDLKIATIDYNIRYSRETYQGAASMVIPFQRLAEQVHVDALWFIASVGAVLLAWRLRERAALMTFAWLLAAIFANVINGSRGLPQYFVQANPALALVGAAGLATLPGRRRWLQAAVGVLLAVGLLWKVGDERDVTMRLSGLPGAIDNIRFDLRYWLGRMDRQTLLSKFGGQRAQDKFNALAVEQLAAHIRETTAATDAIYVFGYAPGVYVKSGRVSASRFVWSRPVIMEFSAEYDGYGSAGLLRDLEHRPPALVALQRQDWGPVGQFDPGRHGEPNSIDFFHHTAPLNDWLLAHYTLDLDWPDFEVWRRRS